VYIDDIIYLLDDHEIEIAFLSSHSLTSLHTMSIRPEQQLYMSSSNTNTNANATLIAANTTWLVPCVVSFLAGAVSVSVVWYKCKCFQGKGKPPKPRHSFHLRPDADDDENENDNASWIDPWKESVKDLKSFVDPAGHGKAFGNASFRRPTWMETTTITMNITIMNITSTMRIPLFHQNNKNQKSRIHLKSPVCV
jgi:hypothetical protein